MNWEQVKGIVERIAYAVIAFVVGKGWLPAAVSADVVAAIVLVIGIVWGWKVNTPAALDKAAKDVR